MTGQDLRCAVHPGRPAADRCPVCARPRCAADAAARGAGCPACARPAAAVPARPAPPLERLVRGTLAALGAALLGGLVAAQYVGAGLFSYLTPLVVGVLCGASAQAAAGGSRRGATAVRVRAAAAACAVLGAGLGLLLEGSAHPLSAPAAVPAVLAAAGALLWTAPPRPAANRPAGEPRPTGGRGG